MHPASDILLDLVWIALGSALGGMARFFVSGFVGRRIGETFPWGTMVVNVTGAFAIGVAAALALAHPDSGGFRIPAFAVTGFLGSYTTVSSFSLQTLALARDGDWLRAGGNVALSVGLGLCAVALGFAAAVSLWGAGA